MSSSSRTTSLSSRTTTKTPLPPKPRGAQAGSAPAGPGFWMFAVNSVPHAPDSGNLRSPLTPTSVGKSESCWRSDSLESGSQARSDEEQHGDGNGVKVSIKNTFLDLHAEETRDHPRRSRSVPSRAADVAMKEGAAPKCVAGEAAGCAEGRSLLPYSAGCSVRGGERDAALASDFASPGHAWLCG
ncbi:unnamed protein product, partial [Prorocentrum cordatum]